jgi:hypothetical protein
MPRNLYERGTIALSTGLLPGAATMWRVTRASDGATATTGDYDGALAFLGLRRPLQLNPAVTAAREPGDDGDPWGSGMAAAWAVVTVADALGMDIPAEMGYSRGATTRAVVDGLADALDCEGDSSCDDITHGEHDYATGLVAAEYRAGNITRDHLKLAMLTLSRYLDAARAAGLDY